MKVAKKHLGIFISGSGSTAQAVVKACIDGTIPNTAPVLVISSNPHAEGIAKAHALGVPTITINAKQFSNASEFGAMLLRILSRYEVDIVSQNGWFPLTPQNVITAYEGKIINQHPGPLDPGHFDFGGKGMYGKRVTCARIAFAWLTGADFWTEATTHHVTADFDKGTIISTEKCTFPFREAVQYGHVTRHPETLIEATTYVADSLLPLEHRNVIATIAAFGKTGKFPVMKRDAILVKSEYERELKQAKELALKLFPNG